MAPVTWGTYMGSSMVWQKYLSEGRIPECPLPPRLMWILVVARKLTWDLWS